MGTKGRDASLWLVFAWAGIAGATASKVAVLLAALCALVFVRHHLWELPRAEKLDYVCLLPLNKYWARFLVRGRIHPAWDRAFEVHIRYRSGVDVREQRDGVLRDLCYLRKNRPGLYLWETATSLPGPVKRLIALEASKGRAFWQRGCFWPRFPLTYRKTRKRIRHGALLVTTERQEEGCG